MKKNKSNITKGLKDILKILALFLKDTGNLCKFLIKDIILAFSKGHPGLR